MGIRHLQRWVDEHCVECSNLQVVRVGTRLIIDGLGLCYFLINKSPAARLGDYKALDVLVRSALRSLKRAGLRVSVYLDGRGTMLKSATLVDRRLQRAQRWERLQAKCLGGAAVEPSELHEPGLMIEQFALSAAAAEVDVHQCKGEADPEMARACFESDGAVILGEDSDFYLYRDVQACSFHFARAQHVSLSPLTHISGS